MHKTENFDYFTKAWVLCSSILHDISENEHLIQYFVSVVNVLLSKFLYIWNYGCDNLFWIQTCK